MIGRVRVTLRHRLHRVGRRPTESGAVDGHTLLDVREGMRGPLVVQSSTAPATPAAEDTALEAVVAERAPAGAAPAGTATHGVVRHPKNAPLEDDATRLLAPDRTATPADDDPPIGSWQGWHVRAGIRPLLLSLDVVAAAAGMLVTDGLRPVMVVFAGLLFSFYAAAGLYKSRLSISLLDDLPQLVGRLLAALALTMMLQTALR